jgi:hypothetical protein
MKVKFILTALLVLGLGYAVTAPYLTVQEMRTAARQHDADALCAHIDFPSVRQSFKDQFDAAIRPQSNDNVFATLGAVVAGAVLDRLIDFMVTPDGIRQLMSGVQPSADSAPRHTRGEPFGEVSQHYASLDRFVATVRTDKGKPIDFVLQRHGLQWKVAEIRLPLHGQQ